MEQLISRTKILPPRYRADLLSRPRLLDTLTDLFDYKLILLIAPAGYGKTYTLMDLCRTVELRNCWYSVTGIDNDITRFVAHFIAALRQTFPEFGEESLSALRNYNPGRDGIERIVIPVVNELYTHVDEHFVFVIDDYHLVDDNDDIGLFVSQFVQHVDENCHLILSSRTLLSLPDLPLLVARGWWPVSTTRIWRFNVDELQTLVLQNFDMSLSESRCRRPRAQYGRLDHRHDAVGPDAAMECSRPVAQGDGAAASDCTTTWPNRSSINRNPIFAQFLLRTSVMDEFDGDLCEQVLLPEWLPPGRTWRNV